MPNIGGNEWAYVKDCLDAGWVSSVGAYVERFERALAEQVGARHAVAMASGTAALHVGLMVAGVKPEDEVVLPPLTFIAPANTTRYIGAWPAFVDIDPGHWQLDPAALEAFLREDCEMVDGRPRNRHTGRRVSAILPVDILGHPCDMQAIVAIAERFGLAVVEDATESLGATCRGRPLGAWSPITCFSFNGNKIVTTGGGGMLVTDDETMARRAKYLSTQAKDDPIEFVHCSVGYNYRLTNVQAAMGCAQLEQLPRFVERKQQIASRYATALRDVPGITPMREASWARSTHWLSAVLVDEPAFGMGSRQLMAALEREKIQTRPLWQLLNCSPALRGSFARTCPNAQRVQQSALCLPSSTGLTGEDQDRVIAAIRGAARGA
ncbi:MAG: LegC family aminotransferase [Gemmatimonadales bacterium]